MKKLSYIRKRIYDYFHPSLIECLEMFAIVEKHITPEEAERCGQLLKEWEEEERIECHE